MPSDPVMDLHAQGLSAREIGERTGKTRNAVLGYIYRYRARKGPPVTKRPDLTDGVIRSALDRNGHNLTATALELGISQNQLYRKGFRGKNLRGPNRAIDPDTRALIDEIEASGLRDRFITIEVDMAFNNISSWRSGRHSARPFLAQCVRTVIADAS